jgi:predicted HAD superfamily Cof-like phosphohydrolase
MIAKIPRYIDIVHRDLYFEDQSRDFVAIINSRTKLDAFEDVLAFHRKFELPRPSVPMLLPPDQYEFRLKFLKEELAEFEAAHAAGNLTGATDALLDLVYVAYGTAIMMGLRRIWARCWGFVQTANLKKVRVARPSESKRGSAFDVRKPEGWVGPDEDIAAVIRRSQSW